MPVLILKPPMLLNHTIVVLYSVSSCTLRSLSRYCFQGSMACTMLLLRSYLCNCLWSLLESVTLRKTRIFSLSQYGRPYSYSARHDFELLSCARLFSNSFTSLYLIILLNIHIHINKNRSSGKQNAFVMAPGKCCLQNDV